MPRAGEVSLDRAVLVFTLVVRPRPRAVRLVPAVSGSRVNLQQSLKTRGSARSGVCGRRCLTFQIAAAVVLLAGAGLLMHSFHRLMQVDTGFSIDRVLTVRFFLPRVTYPVEKCVQLYQQMIERALERPREWMLRPRRVCFRSRASARTYPSSFRIGTGGSRRAARRRFRDRDAGLFPIDEHPGAARTRFRERRPCRYGVRRCRESCDGRALLPESGSDRPVRPCPWPEAAHDCRRRRRHAAARAPLQLPVPRSTFPTRSFRRARCFWSCARAVTRRSSRASCARRFARSTAIYPIASIRTAEDVLDETLSSRRFSMILLTLFAATALSDSRQSAIFGVISFAVSHRATKEIGIRMAFGATASNVLRRTISQGMLPVAVGMLLGSHCGSRADRHADGDAVWRRSCGSAHVCGRRDSPAGGGACCRVDPGSKGRARRSHRGLRYE